MFVKIFTNFYLNKFKGKQEKAFFDIEREKTFYILKQKTIQNFLTL